MATASALDILYEAFDDEVRVDEAGRLAEPKRIGEILPAVLARLGLDIAAIADE